MLGLFGSELLSLWGLRTLNRQAEKEKTTQPQSGASGSWLNLFRLSLSGANDLSAFRRNGGDLLPRAPPLI